MLRIDWVWKQQTDKTISAQEWIASTDGRQKMDTKNNRNVFINTWEKIGSKKTKKKKREQEKLCQWQHENKSKPKNRNEIKHIRFPHIPNAHKNTKANHCVSVEIFARKKIRVFLFVCGRRQVTQDLSSAMEHQVTRSFFLSSYFLLFLVVAKSQLLTKAIFLLAFFALHFSMSLRVYPSSFFHNLYLQSQNRFSYVLFLFHYF